MNLLNQFSRWVNSVEIKLEEPVDLFGDPHKIADKLDEMKVMYCIILHHIASIFVSYQIILIIIVLRFFTG